MPQISAQSTRSPAKICARLSPPKTGRRRRGASGTVGGGSSSSVCSAMVADPFRQLRGNDPVPAQDDQEDSSEEHTSELQSLMRISYAVFRLKNKTTRTTNIHS